MNSWMTENDGDFPEDFRHENGNYGHTCVICSAFFVGHKKRWICKLCNQSKTPRTDGKCRHKDIHGNTYLSAWVEADFSRGLEEKIVSLDRQVFMDAIRLAKMQDVELKMGLEHKILKEILYDRCFYASCERFSRTGYSFEVEIDTADMDIEYRGVELFQTPQMALDFYIEKHYNN